MFSADVARALVETNAIAPLKFMPNEDATFGFWVMGMDLRHVDQPKVGRGTCDSPYTAEPASELLSMRRSSDEHRQRRSALSTHLQLVMKTMGS